jgi:FixJ family two-component response regulator
VFARAEDFLRALAPDWRGCVVADIRMPGMSGLELQRVIAQRASLPVIVVTGHGDVAAAREAMQAHAVDFLQKPFDEALLVAAIERALASVAADDAPPPAGTRPRASALSAREREVMELVVDGLDNRRVGERLGISPRTVEVHKSRVMAKLGARNLAELIRIAQSEVRAR